MPLPMIVPALPGQSSNRAAQSQKIGSARVPGWAKLAQESQVQDGLALKPVSGYNLTYSLSIK